MFEFLRSMFWSFISMVSNQRGTDVVEIADTTTTDLDNAIPEHWATKIRLDAIKNAFWGSRFEGKQGSRMPIIANTDFTKAAGDKIHFQTMSRLYNAGVTGESVLTGNEEKLALGQYDLQVEWVRHAVGFNKRATKRANFDAVKVAGDELAEWMGRRIDDNMMEQLVSTETTQSTIYAGNKTSSANLTSSDVFNTDALDRMKLAMLRKGALPFQVKSVGGVNLKFFGIVIDPIDAYNLRGDEAWWSAQRDANLRGMDNPIFTGALGIYNGVIVYEFGNVGGKQGTWLRPEAALSAAITAGATTITCTLDGDTSAQATKYFAASGTLTIDNEEITYSAKSGQNAFTVTSRGVNGTTAASHASGARVTQRNVATQIGFGAEVAVRGWGLYPRATKQVQDFGFHYGVGVEAVFGQIAVKDKDGNCPNYVLMKSYTKNPNSTL